jgi:hypothetical protein
MDKEVYVEYRGRTICIKLSMLDIDKWYNEHQWRTNIVEGVADDGETYQVYRDGEVEHFTKGYIGNCGVNPVF